MNISSCRSYFFIDSIESLNFLDSVIIWSLFDNCRSLVKKYNKWRWCDFKKLYNLNKFRIRRIDSKCISFVWNSRHKRYCRRYFLVVSNNRIDEISNLVEYSAFIFFWSVIKEKCISWGLMVLVELSNLLCWLSFLQTSSIRKNKKWSENER